MDQELTFAYSSFYIHRPAEPYKEPHLFVPTYQFEHLLDVVNAKLDTWLTIPDGANEKKFRAVFGRGGTPRPRFLGRTTCLEEFQDLTEDFPPIHPDDSLKNTPEEDRGWFLDFLAFIDRAQEKKSKSDKNRAKRMRTYHARGRSIKRVQRYLGLREGITDAKPVAPKKLDLAVPTAIKPEKSVLFVAIDIEAYEFNQQLVTEVGIAVLDTNKLVGVAPGEGGENWFSLIDARHIRVKENDWAVNRTHVHGCPDRFQFGYVIRFPIFLSNAVPGAEANWLPVKASLLPKRMFLCCFERSSSKGIPRTACRVQKRA